MAKILGLDLGTNSIGWAIVDNEKQEILGMGSRIFLEGVNNLGEGEGRELSKNAGRTEARGTRRQIFRRRLRKKILLQELWKHGMCPLTAADFEKWKHNRIFPEKKLALWFKLNPYQLRAKAIEEQLTLEELGRVFYHLIQRRGFQSNSRKGGKEDGTIFKGDTKLGKIGIDETRSKIKDKTLGNHLYSIYPEDNQPYTYHSERIRNRYTTRTMYIDEFEKIWEVQSNFHQILTPELKEILGGRKKDGYSKDGILFHQRPLKSQKHLIGKCTFEPTKNKAHKSSILFEQFKIWQWVNTVDCNGEKLSDEERQKTAELLFNKDKIRFKDVRKVLGKLDSAFKFNYKDDDRIDGSYTISQLSHKKFFGKKWYDFSEKEQGDVWHVLHFFEDKNKVKEYAIKHWNFDEEQAEKISVLYLKEGYANISTKAIRNILPFLEQGYTYDLATVFGGIKNAFGANWDQLTEEQTDLIDSNIPDIIRSKIKGGFIDELKRMLQEEFGLSDSQLKKLYHHSASILATQILDRLPISPEADREIQEIRNPVVVTALFEIRKVMNELIDRFGKPDEIKIELARDLKGSKKQRHQTRLEQKRLERENDRVKLELNHHNIPINHKNLLKYKLWEECKQTCPFTGKKINLQQLFSGEVQIEHIHPWSRSLNDSFMNKTLCYADENREKGNKTPFEFYGDSTAKWEEVKQRALSLFTDRKEYPKSYLKFKHFIKQNYDDDFVSRQLNDTRYISKEASNYLSKVCDKVNVSPGMVTSTLRHYWGLNNILNLKEDKKTRDDHRHHAVDALVVASTKVAHVQELARWNSYDRSYDLKKFPKPWINFREDAEKKTAEILVSHKKNRQVLTIRNTRTEKDGKTYTNKGIAARGQLHKESVFGKRKNSIDGSKAFHIRKPLNDLTTKKQLDKIVDPAVRKLILDRIEEQGGFEKGDKIPKDTFFETDERGNLQPQIFLPNKNGEPVPIKKVRIKENIGGAEQLKEDINQFVNPRSNHHVLIYEDESGDLQEDVVTFWTAVERKKQKQPVVQLPSSQEGKPEPKEIISTLQINEMFLLGLRNDEVNWNAIDFELIRHHLYRVQKLSSKFYEFRLNSESTLESKENPYYVRIQSFGDGKTGWKTFNPIKVKITPTGQIQKL